MFHVKNVICNVMVKDGNKIYSYQYLCIDNAETLKSEPIRPFRDIIILCTSVGIIQLILNLPSPFNFNSIAHSYVNKLGVHLLVA